MVFYIERCVERWRE